MKTFKALAALIDYPEQELVDALDELREALNEEGLVGNEARAGLDALIARLESRDLLDSQAEYVGLFDRVRSLSLHLFEHVHGESRDRGQAMVNLREAYAAHGFVQATSELPDFIPVFLEYLSSRPLAEAREQLEDTAHILQAIQARLTKRGSRYAAVFAALLAIAGVEAEPIAISDDEIRSEDDPATLDKLWQEEPAFGGAPKTSGPSVSVIQFHPRRDSTSALPTP